jgi:nitroreductase
LGETPLPDDHVGLLEGLTSTRAIRRYIDEPVPDDALRAMLFAATRAPSGSNRQGFRFVVLTDDETSMAAKALIGEAGRRIWRVKREHESYDAGSGTVADSPKARMARVMQRFVEEFERIPVVVLACHIPHRELNPATGASVYPACQNLLLAARALGYGGVMTGWHEPVTAELKELLGIPAEVFIAAAVALGRPEGSHGPVRRRPLPDLVYGAAWGRAPNWAVDPPGTRHTSGGPKQQGTPGSSF